MDEARVPSQKAERLQNALSDLGHFEVEFLDVPHRRWGASVFHPETMRGMVITTEDECFDFAEPFRKWATN